jgi:tellurite resistance protein
MVGKESLDRSIKERRMRSNPKDIAEAMARIVAVALCADGALDHSEVEALEEHELRDTLGLPAATLERVRREFCIA